MRTLVIALAALALASPVWAEPLAEPLVIEGQVFVRQTGVPLEWAEVYLSDSFGNPISPNPGPLSTGGVRTDANGFYRLSYPEGTEFRYHRFDAVALQAAPRATCEYDRSGKAGRTEARTKSSGRAQAIYFDEAGFHERNLYIDVPTRLGKSGCNQPYSTIGPGPVIPTVPGD